MTNKPQANRSIAEIYGYTHEDFKRWGKMGGRPAKYVNNAERHQAYRRRKAQRKLDLGLVKGILCMKTGRIRKYRNSAERQRVYYLQKKLKEKLVNRNVLLTNY